MILPEFLVQDADVYIHLAGHRIGLQDVTYYYNEGCSAEELCEVFPTLPLALIHKVIAFYLDSRANGIVSASLISDVETSRSHREVGGLISSLALNNPRKLRGNSAARIRSVQQRNSEISRRFRRGE
ncbi:MAG: DUF433 domain-containing protein [Planctomycetes bacterium]|nr:DUF433 domain-containing protein [Planctomycetota bacterium]